MAEQLLSRDPGAAVLLSSDPRAGAAAPLSVPRDSRGMPAVSSNTSDDSSDLLKMLGPLAHPETLTDFARLLTLPVDSVRKAALGALAMTKARPAASAALTKTGQAVEKTGDVLDNATTKTIGAYELMHSPVKGAAVLAGPKLVKGVGQVLQKAGAAIAPAAEAAPVAAPVVAEAAPVARAAGSLPDQKALNEAALAARRAAYQAAKGSAPAAEAAPAASPAAVQAATKLNFNADEWKEFQRLLGRGVKTQDALRAVQQMRELAAKLGGASPSEVAKAVAHRNTTGQW